MQESFKIGDIVLVRDYGRFSDLPGVVVQTYPWEPSGDCWSVQFIPMGWLAWFGKNDLTKVGHVDG